MKRALKYPGSKWNLVPKLLALIPEHHTYLEPFFGSGALFFSKAPSAIETINDMDNQVVNLFSCIRDDPERLARMVMTIPYSRYQYDQSYKVEYSDPYENALQFLIKCWQGYGFRTNGKVGWKNDIQGRESMYALWNWYRLPDIVVDTAERLRKVQIENRPALEVMERYDFENVFIYLDPPYVLGTRARKQYMHEMTDRDHVDLLNFCLRSKAKIMISGYESDLYNNMLEGWNKRQFDSCAEMSGKRDEIIWFNYDVEGKQISLQDFMEI